MFVLLLCGSIGLRAQVATAYTFASSSGSYSAITGGTVLFGGVVELGTIDDDISAAQTIAPFNYGGTTYTQLFVSANGFITFGSAPSGTNYTPLSSGAGYAGAIAAFGTDLQHTNAGFGFTSRSVRIETVGSEVVVQWKGMRRKGVNNENFNFQIRLNTSTNVIKMVYGSLAGQGSSTSFQPEAGLRGPDNTFATNVNNRSVGTGAETWAASLAGTANNSTMRFTTAAPAKAFTNGLTYTFTPCSAPSVSVNPSSATYCSPGSALLTASGASGTYAWSPATGLDAVSGSTVTTTATATITYTVTGLNAGCPFSSSANVTVTVNPGPSVPVITPTSATICAGVPEPLSASSTSVPTVTSSSTATGGPASVTNGAAQNASIYPWNNTVAGLPTSGVTVASVTINGVTHTFPDDLDILLQSPSGTNVVLMSDVGGGTDITGNTYTFATGSPAMADAAANASGTYAPTNIGASDDYPTAPGPGNGFSQASPSLGSFTGNPNGTWKLLIRDDANGDAGSIAGWSITFSYANTLTYTWSPNVALSSTTGAAVTAAPTSDQTYTVTVSQLLNACTSSSNVSLTTVAAPNAGINGTLTVCSNDGAANLFAQLGGSPDGGGAWSGPDAVIGGLYDPATMGHGTYTYTVSGNAPCANATADVVVTENAATLWYADIDGDGFGDAGDSQLACAQPGGYVADNSDLCPADPLKQSPGICGCGVADVATTWYADTDGDGFGDLNDSQAGYTCIQPSGYVANSTDLCPADPLKQNPGQCGCGNPDTDTDNDGTADCNDLCPNDPNKVAPGQCGCGVPDTDTDGDGVADCIDNCVSTPNPAQDDTDGDLLGDACDPCPLGPNPGSACNDNNPFTINDVIGVNCSCAGTPVPCDTWTLTINTDANGNETTWQVVDANSPFVLDAGGPYTANSTVTESFCVPQGACFNLIVNDAGNNGMGNGGYVLTDNNGRRVIDNAGNGAAFTSTSQAPLPFCSPVGTDKLIASHCDVETWIPNEFMIASPNAAVSAEFGVGDQTDDGYEFWLFNPNGGYSRKVFLSHATPMTGAPAGATAAAHLRFSALNTNPVPANVLLNVRIRTRVNGVNSAYGPVCRFKIDVVAANCPSTQLIATPGSTFSCGATGKLVNGPGASGRLYAVPVVRVVNGNNQPANRYQFELSIPAEGYVRNIQTSSYTLVLGTWATNPLLCGTYTYDVRVRASFDNGATWCPWGSSCTAGITNNEAQPLCTTTGNLWGGDNDRVFTDGDEPVATTLTLWPNPNQGDQVNLVLDHADTEATTAHVDIYDLTGHKVSGRTIALSGGTLRTVIALDGGLAKGLYLVSVTIGETVHTQRLVIQ
jgi:subtilisin-like proprotein convertase family protein